MDITLPLEDDKIMSGYFGFVAICVTQPLWPISVPRNCSVSLIFVVQKMLLLLQKFAAPKGTLSMQSTI